MRFKLENKTNKITKFYLVIYFIIVLALLVIIIIPSCVLKDWTIIYGFLVCLGANLIFALISFFLPIETFFAMKNKKMIFIYCLIYVLKYILLFLTPIICILLAPSLFNKWTMVISTLLAPIYVIALKIVFAIKDSKLAKKTQKNDTNTIKF